MTEYDRQKRAEEATEEVKEAIEGMRKIYIPVEDLPFQMITGRSEQQGQIDVDYIRKHAEHNKEAYERLKKSLE